MNPVAYIVRINPPGIRGVVLTCVPCKGEKDTTPVYASNLNPYSARCVHCAEYVNVGTNCELYRPKCGACLQELVPTITGGWGCPTLGTPECIRNTKPETVA